jgi:filamentous hemagglutinin
MTGQWRDWDVPAPDKGGAIVYPRGSGASVGPVPEGYVPVSRWIGEAEANIWLSRQGTSIPGNVGSAGRLYVTSAGAPKPGGTGPVRVDFSVPVNLLNIGGRVDWFFIMQPASNVPIYNVSINYP